jgi:hypothetical protein
MPAAEPFPLSPAVFDSLRCALADAGPAVAAERLVTALREAGQYDALFYALLLRARQRLGADPVPSRPAQELPEALHAPYEEAIREAARTVGRLYLDNSDIPHAWNYYRLIGEREPVRDALDRCAADAAEEAYPLVEIALHHGVHPRKGFDLVLDRQGVCSAITLMGNFEAALAPDVRAYCIGRLVHALHEQLLERLRQDIGEREGKEPAATGLAELIAGRDALFGDDSYHIDTSHLASVVQLSAHLSPGDPALPLAIELCDYGARLSPKLRLASDPPFEDIYADYGAYLRVLAGTAVEEGLAHFRAKAEAMDAERGTLPAEVYVNLLIHCGREAEALAAARKYLTRVDERQLSCPGPLELSRRRGDYAAFAEVARARGDAVHFLAGLFLDQETRRPGDQEK